MFSFHFLASFQKGLDHFLEESGPVLTHWLLLGVLLQLLGLLRECLHQDLKFFIYFQEIKAGVLHIQRSGWLWRESSQGKLMFIGMQGMFLTPLELGSNQYFAQD